MEKDSFKILEYSKIKDMLAERASSRLGRERAEQLQPSSDSSEVEEWLSETAQASLVLETGTPPLGGIRDIRELLKKVRKGAALDLAELQDVQSTLYAMRQVKYFFRDSELDVPILKDWAHAIEILGQLERHIDNIVDEHGNMRETASVELARIRRELRQSQNTIKERVNGILHSAEYQKYFQDAIVTVRDDRYCIPIKAEYQSRFPGLIHDRSASGSTLFIEPMAVVELNNDIKQLELAEQQEVARIMRDISREIGKNSETLLDNCSILADLDFAFAKARLAADMGAVRPVLNAEGVTRIYGARHPLIPKNKVVPIDIQLGDGYKMLLVTGPNTGGKTVSMKTLGLIVLMVQSGCYMPADPGSEIAVYDNLYADIGDEQSIEQSLSTFSAHITNIIGILKLCNRSTLAVIDELGAGTDPVEGAALAVAILEKLRERGAKIAATTHYSELKEFALKTPGVENGCCEFDVTTLRPTYKLLIGVPGKSNAFAISKRLGMEGGVIDRARELTSSESRQFENVVESLEVSRKELTDELEKARQATVAAQQKQAQAEKELERAKLDAKREVDMAKQKAQELAAKTRAQAYAIIDELEQAKKNKRYEAEQKQKFKSGMKELEETADPIKESEQGDYKLPRELKIGDNVLIFDIDKKAVVLEKPEKDSVLVQAGIIKTRVKLNNLRLLQEDKVTVPKRRERTVTKDINSVVKNEIDVRGQTAEEAIMSVDSAIDSCQLTNVRLLTIIHGKGTGVLRSRIQQYLRHHKAVGSFRLGTFGEGESGVTIVELK